MAVFSTPDPPPEDAKESEDCDNSAAMASTRRMFDCGVWKGCGREIIRVLGSALKLYEINEFRSE